MPRHPHFLFLLMACAALSFLLGTAALAQTQPGPLTRIPTPDAAAKGDYQQVPVSTAIDLLEQHTGKRYIRDANLEGVPPISFNIGGLDKDDAIKLVTSTLLLNGVAIIPVDDKTAKVVTTGTNKNPRSEGMRAYTNAADLPADDEIVTYYMALDHIDPQEAAGIFTQVAPVHTYGSYVPAPSSQGVILTENASVIRELIDLKKSIDVSKAPNVPRPPPDRAGPPPGPPGRPGFPPPPRPHPVIVVLVFLLIVTAVGFASFRAGVRRGRNKPPSP